MRDANDWRIGDVIIEGPDFKGSWMATDRDTGKVITWEEFWDDGTHVGNTPKVRRVSRCNGNVIRVSIWHRKVFKIGPRTKRYVLNPACENGGYRTTNDRDPMYQTDNQGRFVHSSKRDLSPLKMGKVRLNRIAPQLLDVALDVLSDHSEKLPSSFISHIKSILSKATRP